MKENSKEKMLPLTFYWAKCIVGDSDTLSTPRTKHTFFELEYALEGNMNVYLDEGKLLSLSSGEFCLIPPERSHQLLGASERGKRFILAFAFSDNDPRYLQLKTIVEEPLLHKETPTLKGLMDLLLMRLQEDPLGTDPITDRIAETLICELCFILNAGVEGAIGNPSHASNGIIDEMNSYIRARAGVNIGLRDLAERFHFSERHINRLFLSAFGKTAGEVIRHEKMKHLEKLLLSTQLSLGEVAEFCGFSDEYAMNRFFKKTRLINLSDYRKIQKKKIRE